MITVVMPTGDGRSLCHVVIGPGDIDRIDALQRAEERQVDVAEFKAHLRRACIEKERERRRSVRKQAAQTATV